MPRLNAVTSLSVYSSPVNHRLRLRDTSMFSAAQFLGYGGGTSSLTLQKTELAQGAHASLQTPRISTSGCSIYATGQFLQQFLPITSLACGEFLPRPSVIDCETMGWPRGPYFGATLRRQARLRWCNICGSATNLTVCSNREIAEFGSTGNETNDLHTIVSLMSTNFGGGSMMVSLTPEKHHWFIFQAT